MFAVTDTELSSRFPIYTRANVGEVFPDPVTPATRSPLLWESELGWRDAYARTGAFEPDEFPEDAFTILGVAGGYCYPNASVVRTFGERAPGLSWKTIDEQILGAQPGIPDDVERSGDVRPDLTERLQETFGWVFGQTSVGDLDRLTEHRERTIRLCEQRPDLASMSDQELGPRTRMFPVASRVLLRARLRVDADDRAGRRDPGHRRSGRTPRSHPAAHRRCRPGRLGRAELCRVGAVTAGSEQRRVPQRVRAVPRRARKPRTQRVGGSLTHVGDRSEPGPRGDRPHAQRPRGSGSAAAPGRARRRAGAGGSHPAGARRGRSRSTRPAGRSDRVVRGVAAGPRTHEEEQHPPGPGDPHAAARARTTHGRARRVRRDRGLRFRAERRGRRVARPRVRVAARADPGTQAHYVELGAKVPPFVFAEQPSDPVGWSLRESDTAERMAGGESIQGFPGCPGVAEGRARVVLDSHDPSALEPGDVLVAPITDPSWTPLFVPTGGVVVDVGAALSHAIIVNREPGIPRVVSATDATRRIPDGALVRVDGNTRLRHRARAAMTTPSRPASSGD